MDAGRAREIYFDALSAALFAGRFAKSGSVVDAAKAARSASPSSRPGAWDLLLDGLTAVITEGPSVGVPTLKRALSVLRDEPVGAVEPLSWLWLADRAAGFIWDYDTWDALTSRQIQLARDAGALTVLPMTLSTRSVLHLLAGELSVAASMVEEVEAIIGATESRTVTYAPLTLAAFRGREAEAARLIQGRANDFIARGEGMGLTHTHWATAALCNGLARYEDALAAAERAYEDPRELSFSTWATVELIEAASRSGKPERAANALDALAETTQAAGTDWGLAVEARSRALLSPDDRAEVFYREAIDRLQHTRLRVDLARAHLVYGEWLRRERRRLDAREQLGVAYDLFTDFGMEAFAERARIELRATGQHARKRNVETRDDLTAQEAFISRLAAQGATNQEIAAQLFISPRTVEYHLRKTFRKLDVKSRTQLAHRLQQQDVRGEAAIRQS